MSNIAHKVLIQKYFQKSNFVSSDIDSFNTFIEVDLNDIIEENKEIEPTIIPQNVDEFKIRMDKIWVTKPEIIEADGSKRPIFPAEARLRKITYSAPIFIEVSAHINGVQRESFTTQIGNLPIMLKSKYCHLHSLSNEELIAKGEDPTDPGGYFIINGSEKVLITMEDLVPNKMLITKTSTGPSAFSGTLFSEKGSFKIPHTLERMKDGIFYLTLTRIKRVPLVVIIKALGMVKDEEIMKVVSKKEPFNEVLINLYEFVEIKNEDDAVDYIAKKIGITQSKEIRVERTRELLDKYLLPHIGINPEDRLAKAYNLCKHMKKFLLVESGRLPIDDRDHYMNKRLKMSGDLLASLVRVNFKVLISDMLYNFQRIVKRGKFPSIKVIIRDKLLTSRIYSAMATGSWVGGRKGISQRIQRLNYLDFLSHLQRVVSPLSSSQENFEARELHPTHLGRLCPIETPEGTNIGLRKNLALLCTISQETPDEDIIKSLRNFGLKTLP
ncbi:DNA-directed RNA polymerase subunit B'' [Candidatus Woesearchaeota archaeon]|nr:MAG: DNA-directed RNA polymerase subunit B [archaeon GW2011_AR4]MBS3129493.1 DNA-directed RNA polymerase subunit B'' [Candidatus Woesearchaeota archaeon]HIH38874.1 DNA-directed RNA polymerase subunit B'' [Candidatus Woesearchaeota archaeon]HIH48704.1 DNA-directed RNA polymerase subunit B'' [Candidatus Woesearchaeota archaeon]HIJ03780.1 DNA-directed RNA polymerase subunit B'' [Candidatus Woesearchaeota archaeon]